MPPITQKNYFPIYTIDRLISEKSFNEKITSSAIKRQLADLLGITLNHLWKIRTTQVGENEYLKPSDLQKLAEYFKVSIEELLSESLQHQLHPGAEASLEDRAGIPFNPIAKS